MYNYAKGVSPSVLKWAREQSGYSLQEVAEIFDKQVEEISMWETGEAVPTYIQLEKLSYTIYKRPIAIFFFPEPPEEQDPHQSFRTLPGELIDNLRPDTRLAIREAKSMQIALSELNDGVNPAMKKIFQDFKLTINTDIRSIVQQIREYIDLPVDKQIKWKSEEEALKIWRDKIQDLGIFVFKRSFKQKGISGFCLYDEVFPIIYLNNSTSKARQIFTLLHELGHLLIGANGITKTNDNYIHSMTGVSQAIEVICNRFAGEMLVPAQDFEKRIMAFSNPDQIIENLYHLYRVSREVILRKLLDYQIIDQFYYEYKAGFYNSMYEEKHKKPDEGGAEKGGGNYYATQITYLGDKYLSIAFSRYYSGRCTIEQLADYLNMKVSSIPSLEQRFLTRT